MFDLPPELWQLIYKHVRKLKFLAIKAKLETLFNDIVYIDLHDTEIQLFYRKIKNYLFTNFSMIKPTFLSIETGFYKLQEKNDCHVRRNNENELYQKIPNFGDYSPIVIETYTSPRIEGWASQNIYTPNQFRGWTISNPFRMR